MAVRCSEGCDDGTGVGGLMSMWAGSGLNAAMNARLSGQWGKLFPNMHIQARPPRAPQCTLQA